MNPRRAVPLLLAFVFASPLAAQDGARWTIDDILTAESAGGFAFSPDGRYLAWTKSEMDEDEGRRHSNLWMTRLADGETWPLTRGTDSFGTPKWSPDGTLLAFTSSRDVPDENDDASGSQLWLMRLEGGEPWPVTTALRGLRAFEWKGASSDSLVLAAQELRSQYDRTKERIEDTGIAVEDTLDAPPVRLWSLDIASKALRRLTDQAESIEGFALAPDGRRAITTNTQSLSYGFDAKDPPRTWLVDLADGSRREILTDEVSVRGRPYRIIPGDVQWTRDGAGALLSFEYSSHPVYRTATVTQLAHWNATTGAVTIVDLDWDRGLASFDVVPDGFVATLQDGVRTRPARFARAGSVWTRAWIDGEHTGEFVGWTVNDGGDRVAYVRSTADTPPQPFAAKLEGTRIVEPVRIAELNPSYAKKPSFRAEVIRWAGARGDSVEGILYYPIGWQEGRRHPLIHSIHGGPASADRDAWSQSWSTPIVLYLQKGAFVLKTNYHGSCCYGLDWVESIGGGNYYSLEVPDLEAGAQHLIDSGLVHPDSIATAGWSNGAILSSALTVENPARYKAAIIGAGDVEWISDWGNVDFGASFDNYYFGASPIEDPQRYIELSPYFRLDEVRTPTLLFTGTEDRNVPPSQSWSHFRALQQLGNTEVRLVLFPGEPHGLGKLAHQRRKVREELRWLDVHLWGRADTTRLALAPSSPLAALLKRNDVERVDGLLGVRVDGILVPETAERDSLDVGRFEVTRAQWKAFEPAFVIAPGAENVPVTGVSFERAQAYATWLAQRTGRAFRLPTKAEHDALGGSGGNTLDMWAGYTPNPEDARRLEALVAELEGDAPLLREAGASADAHGEPPLWDLAGNAAEWTVGPDGTGVLADGSADRPSDAHGQPMDAAPAYRGLRVVVGR